MEPPLDIVADPATIEKPLSPMEIDEAVSVLDPQAFAEKNLADLGQEEEDFQVCHWDIPSWKALDKRITGPEFEAGGHRWRILLFPFGNSNGQPNDMVSVYLDYADSKGQPEGWHVCAQFALVISHPDDPTVYCSSQAHHRFTAEEMDWGFTRFNELRKLKLPADGRPRPVIEDDRARISAYVRVLKDPTGVLWHNFINYDSKKETGYVGLKNQGATCYMNSLLQSLFCTHYFRRAVYQIPTESDTPSESVPLALQRVFYMLQTSDQPVGTNELTKSFGWKSLDSFLQHDVQEFNRVLQEKLESKMKGTAADGAISRLFVGRMKSYLKCVNVEYESSREEDFYDIQLNVKGMPNLEASFRDYIQTEMLEGDNKYHAEGFGLQDAKKGVIFQKFPPVLHLQLKRFEYDIEKDAMVKINDRHEFPLEIDLADYLDPANPDKDTQSWVYKLHGVLVHSGDLHGGHYFALLKPEKDGKWFKFDDDRVTPVTIREVLEDNFGGEMTLTANGGQIQPNANLNPQQQQQLNARAPVRTMKRFTNAYMLVYVREATMSEVLKPFGPDDTPAHLAKRLEDERQQLEARRREKEEQHLFLTAKVITEETFRKHQGFDLATFEDRTLAPTELPSFRVHKSDTFLSFKAMLSQQFQLPEDQMRLWVLVNRQNKTVRPDTVVPENDPNLTLEVVRDRMASRQNDLRLFLEVLQPGVTPPPPPSAPGTEPVGTNGAAAVAAPAAQQPPAQQGNQMMIFLKHFDISRQTLLGVGRHYVHRNMKVGDLVGTINEIMRWPPTTQVKLYEEIKPGMIEQMKPKATFVQSEIQDGDIICFQMDIPEKDAHDYELQSLYSNPIMFYDFLQNQIKVLFKPRFEDVEPRTEFEVTLSKKMTYDMMAAKAGERLKHDPFKLRFTTANGPGGTPKTVLKRTANQTVSDIVSPSYVQGQASLLYYELLDVSIIELETKRTLKVYWTGAHNKEESTAHTFLLPKTSTINEVIDQLAKLVTLSAEGSKKIRIFEIVAHGKQQREFGPTEMIGNINEATELFGEEISRDELESSEDDKIISVFHFSKEAHRTHGVPFKFVIKRGEKFADTKKRIQARLAVPDKDFAKFRFALVQSSTYKQPSYIEDEDVIYDHKFLPEDTIGLDHPDRTGRAGRVGAVQDKGIKIRN
ncbi:ubiquitin-specific protease ubp15 [Tilletia horrida]|uniref:ubiquitinyl hydrolase 1 n=1 Tax=Tilletia horrida TaxID=155126 RepID=A0AAN6GSU2_9BASI|nr:ubiquitin-specific protease ubp15 [Tilletia horrida]KAK0551533.1 ubiquitin-specific protease ubp15 [Tilletia horrida]KAK0566569.1 ubiquitin-specific protease ubp15 [Tilletia horrida]